MRLFLFPPFAEFVLFWGRRFARIKVAQEILNSFNFLFALFFTWFLWGRNLQLLLNIVFQIDGLSEHKLVVIAWAPHRNLSLEILEWVELLDLLRKTLSLLLTDDPILIYGTSIFGLIGGVEEHDVLGLWAHNLDIFLFPSTTVSDIILLSLMTFSFLFWSTHTLPRLQSLLLDYLVGWFLLLRNVKVFLSFRRTIDAL